MRLFQNPRLLRFLAIAASSLGAGIWDLPATAAGSSTPVEFEFALYFAPNPKSDPESAVARLLKDTASGIVFAGESAPVDAVTVAAHWRPISEYAPPGPDAFRHFAKGLTMEDGARIAQSERVFVMDFVGPKSRAMVAVRLACALVATLADETAGVPWDEECRLLYSAKEWRRNQVDSWQGDIPDMRAQVTMHAYRNPELVRIITLGMRKFGLADLVVKDVPSGNSGPVGHLVNACMQILAEGTRPKARRMTLDLAAIKHDEHRKTVLANPLSGATGHIVIEFKVVSREEGDPKNSLWLADFPQCQATTYTERVMLAVSTVFGTEDRVSRIASGDPEMAAARERARTAFFAQEAAFRRGLEANERLVVKAPFAVNGGAEYMWVEVTKWTDAAVEGILLNDSDFDKSLRHGLRTTVALKDIYDFIHYKSDGTEEGNETGKVLEKRGE